MKVMGERLPEAWLVEMHRNGRVEFPVRRSVWVQVPGFPVLLIALSGAIHIPYVMDSGGRWIGYLMIAAYACAFVGCVWQLVTQRPVLVVDRQGIHRGRTRSMAWSAIGSIGLTSGRSLAQQFRVHPKNVRARDLVLNRMHVNDLEAFRGWLEELLAEQRRQVR
ncbi:hypothetical protein [Kribbella sp. NPDC004875]|uniref:hypothetical protein n=1 Tax=Kribbella sp. NPDC004875 TaxID=3364107 RepID=UPI003681E4D8